MADLISREAVIALINVSIFDLEYADENIAMQEAIKMLPTIEAEPIVRCKDCKNCGDNAGEPEPYFLYCFEWLERVDENGYCYKAERKDEADNG